MKRSKKILAALANRVGVYQALKGTSETEHSIYVTGIGTFHEPGSLNPNKGASEPNKHSRRKTHTAPQGGGSPTRVARRQGTKTATRQLVRGKTRGAVQKARKAVKYSVRQESV